MLCVAARRARWLEERRSRESRRERVHGRRSEDESRGCSVSTLQEAGARCSEPTGAATRARCRSSRNSPRRRRLFLACARRPIPSRIPRTTGSRRSPCILPSPHWLHRSEQHTFNRADVAKLSCIKPARKCSSTRAPRRGRWPSGRSSCSARCAGPRPSPSARLAPPSAPLSSADSGAFLSFALLFVVGRAFAPPSLARL